MSDNRKVYLVYFKDRLISNRLSYNQAMSDLHTHWSNTENAKLSNYHISDKEHHLTIIFRHSHD